MDRAGALNRVILEIILNNRDQVRRNKMLHYGFSKCFWCLHYWRGNNFQLKFFMIHLRQTRNGYNFSYITGVHHIFAFKTFDIAKKKGFLEKTTEK